jgi:hypothetical protein
MNGIARLQKLTEKRETVHPEIQYTPPRPTRQRARVARPTMTRIYRRPSPPTSWTGSLDALTNHRDYVAAQRAASSKKTLSVANDDAARMKPRCREFLGWYDCNRQRALDRGIGIVFAVARQRGRTPTIHVRFVKAASGKVVLSYWPATGVVMPSAVRSRWRVPSFEDALTTAVRASGLLPVDAGQQSASGEQINGEATAAGDNQ